MGERLVLPLQARAVGDPTLVGAKAVGLNLLLRHRFPVPPGFCVLPSSTTTLRGLPPDFRRAIDQAYGRLGTLVAVRPSVAGTAKTLLGINGEEAAARAVARCMTARGESRTGPLCPVILQQLVDAISSGVAYGRHPETGEETEFLIEAGWGIGQPDRSGIVKPDLFRVRKYPLFLLTRDPAPKVRETRAGPIGLVSRPLPQALRLAPSLTDAEAVALAGLVRRIEDRLGYVVEVEWALTKHGFVLLELNRAAEPRRDSFYLHPELAGGYDETVCSLDATAIPAEVISPHAWDFWSRAAGSALYPLLARAGLPPVAKTPPLVLVAGRVYLNATDLTLALEQAIGLSPDSLLRQGTIRPGDGAGLIALFRPRPRLLPRLPALLSYLRHLERDRIRVIPGELEDESERLDRVLQEGLNATQLASTLTAVDAFILDRLEILLAASLAAHRLRRFQRILRRWCGPGGEAAGARLVAGLGALEAAMPGYALWDLARRIEVEASPHEPRETPPRDNRAALAAFVAAHGHHCAGEFDLANPRWGDDPATIVELSAHLGFPENTPAGEHARQQAALRSQAMAWVQGRLSTGWRRIYFRRRRRFAKLHAKLLAAYPLLGNAGSSPVKMLWRYRRLLILAGQDLVGRDWLGRPDQVFLLRTAEICAALRGELQPQQIGERIRQRAAAREFYLGLDPPRVITGPYRVDDFAAPAPVETSSLKGLGASPGRGRGPARLIRSAWELARFYPGEVLVTPKIDAGWSPILLRAEAVVTELGGLMSEAAVLAREYGLPAVVQVEEALACLRDGDLLEVDGEAGEVRLVAHQEKPRPTGTGLRNF